MALAAHTIAGSGYCGRCFIAFGSSERSVPGVCRGREVPVHVDCATPAEKRLAVQAKPERPFTKGNGGPPASG